MRALITCSGHSNVGRLTTQVALTLLQRRPGAYRWVRATQGAAAIREGTEEVDDVIVLDGCDECCASRKTVEHGLAVDHHLVATGLGIVKDGLAEVQYPDIETVVQAFSTLGEDR